MYKLTIPPKDVTVKDGNTYFTVTFRNHVYNDINKDLIKNKKTILEMLMMKMFYPESETIKKFRETKPELVKKISAELHFQEPEELETPNDWEHVQEVRDMTVDGLIVLDPGTYYLGDIGYAVNHYIFHKILADGFDMKPGVYRRKSDGAMFGFFETIEDYRMTDDVGRKYLSDSQTIGLVDLRLCEPDTAKEYYTFTSPNQVWLEVNEDGLDYDIPGYDVHSENVLRIELRTKEMWRREEYGSDYDSDDSDDDD